MKTRLLIIGLMSLVFIQSCEKNDMHNAKLKRILVYVSVDSQIPLSSKDYEYDNHDRISKVTTYMHNANGEIIGIITYDCYEYNSKGQLEKIANYHANISNEFSNLYNYIYSYSDDGLKIKELNTTTKEYSLFKYSNNQLVG